MELKDPSSLISSNGFYSGINIAISIGKVTPLGYFNLNILLFSPSNVKVGVVDLPESEGESETESDSVIIPNQSSLSLSLSSSPALPSDCADPEPNTGIQNNNENESGSSGNFNFDDDEDFYNQNTNEKRKNDYNNNNNNQYITNDNNQDEDGDGENNDNDGFRSVWGNNRNNDINGSNDYYGIRFRNMVAREKLNEKNYAKNNYQNNDKDVDANIFDNDDDDDDDDDDEDDKMEDIDINVQINNFSTEIRKFDGEEDNNYTVSSDGQTCRNKNTDDTDDGVYDEIYDDKLQKMIPVTVDYYGDVNEYDSTNNNNNNNNDNNNSYTNKNNCDDEDEDVYTEDDIEGMKDYNMRQSFALTGATFNSTSNNIPDLLSADNVLQCTDVNSRTNYSTDNFGNDDGNYFKTVNYFTVENITDFYCSKSGVNNVNCKNRNDDYNGNIVVNNININNANTDNYNDEEKINEENKENNENTETKKLTDSPYFLSFKDFDSLNVLEGSTYLRLYLLLSERLSILPCDFRLWTVRSVKAPVKCDGKKDLKNGDNDKNDDSCNNNNNYNNSNNNNHNTNNNNNNSTEDFYYFNDNSHSYRYDGSDYNTNNTNYNNNNNNNDNNSNNYNNNNSYQMYKNEEFEHSENKDYEIIRCIDFAVSSNEIMTETVFFIEKINSENLISDDSFEANFRCHKFDEEDWILKLKNQLINASEQYLLQPSKKEEEVYYSNTSYYNPIKTNESEIRKTLELFNEESFLGHCGLGSSNPPLSDNNVLTLRARNSLKNELESINTEMHRLFSYYPTSIPMNSYLLFIKIFNPCSKEGKSVVCADSARLPTAQMLTTVSGCSTSPLPSPPPSSLPPSTCPLPSTSSSSSSSSSSSYHNPLFTVGSILIVPATTYGQFLSQVDTLLLQHAHLFHTTSKSNTDGNDHALANTHENKHLNNDKTKNEIESENDNRNEKELRVERGSDLNLNLNLNFNSNSNLNSNFNFNFNIYRHEGQQCNVLSREMLNTHSDHLMKFQDMIKQVEWCGVVWCVVLCCVVLCCVLLCCVDAFVCTSSVCTLTRLFIHVYLHQFAI